MTKLTDEQLTILERYSSSDVQAMAAEIRAYRTMSTADSVHLQLSEMPAVITQTVRVVLHAHGYMTQFAAVIGEAQLARLLDEIGCNVSQSLLSIDRGTQS